MYVSANARVCACFLALCAVAACKGSNVAVDAGTDAADASIDVGGSDGGVDARVEIPLSFAWDPWPSGPVPYRLAHETCNHGGGQAGTCPEDFECTGSIDVPFVALTRTERVCERSGGDVRAPIVLNRPVNALAESAVVATLELPWLADAPPTGALRVRDRSGAVVYAEAARATQSLSVDPGTYQLTLTLPDRATFPSWARSGELVVRGPGAIELPMERATFETRCSAELGTCVFDLQSVATGVRRRSEGGPVPIVPSAQRVQVATEFGSADLGEVTGEAEFDGTPVRVSGTVRLDGAAFARGTVRFADADLPDAPTVDWPVTEAGYAGSILPGTYEVYLDTLSDRVAPQSRAWLGTYVVDADRTIDLDALTATWAGTMTVDDAEAPDVTDPDVETRLGILQLVDALGVASRGIVVRGRGGFSAAVLGTRADVRFTGTDPSMPRLAQVVAREEEIGTRGDAALDAGVRYVDVTVHVDGGRVPDGPSELDAPRGRVFVREESREISERLVPFGESVIRMVVPPGVFTFEYEVVGNPFMPDARVRLGEVDADELLTARTFELEVADVRIAFDARPGEQLQFREFGGVSRSDIDAGAARVLLYRGIYDVRTICAGGCGELLLGWTRF